MLIWEGMSGSITVTALMSHDGIHRLFLPSASWLKGQASHPMLHSTIEYCRTELRSYCHEILTDAKLLHKGSDTKGWSRFLVPFFGHYEVKAHVDVLVIDLIYYLAKPQSRERTWEDQRGKKTLLSLTLVLTVSFTKCYPGWRTQ